MGGGRCAREMALPRARNISERPLPPSNLPTPLPTSDLFNRHNEAWSKIILV